MSPTVRATLRVVVAVLSLAVAARLSVPIPGSPVPQSLQTLAVVLVGGYLGPRLGMLSGLAYLAVGSLGLPVFADGGAGLAHITGPTGGYLVGFVAAAGVAGAWMGRSRPRGVGWALLGMALAHGVILVFGWAWLSASFGMREAFARGVQPFLLGGLVKAIAASVIITAWRPSAESAQPPRP